LKVISAVDLSQYAFRQGFIDEQFMKLMRGSRA